MPFSGGIAVHDHSSNSTGGIIINATYFSAIPVGTYHYSARSVAPAGNWVKCNGAAVNRVGTYADLFLIIGTDFGVGDGVNTFNLPDMRGRIPIGVGAGPGLTPYTRGNTFGNEAMILTEGNLPPHKHVEYAQNAGVEVQVFNVGGGGVAGSTLLVDAVANAVLANPIETGNGNGASAAFGLHPPSEAAGEWYIKY